MFNLEEQMKKLTELHDKIERMSRSKEKLLLILNYITYYYIMHNLLPEGTLPFEKDEFYSTETLKKYQKYFMTEVNDVYDSCDIISELFTNTKKINDNLNLTKTINIKDNINPELGLLLVSEFFNNMPDNIQKIYQEVMDGNLFFTLEGDSMAYNIDYWDGSRVKCHGQFKKYYTYMTLAHEIGHCYQFRLNTQSNNFNFIRPDIEVPSIFMEIIFNDFVDKYLYGQEFGIRCLLHRQSMFSSWLTFYEMFFANSEWLSINSEKQITGIINYQDMTEKDRQLLEGDFKSLSKEDYEEYFSLNINIPQLRYPLSNLIAIYFADIYLEDKKTGLRLLKDYLMLPPNVILEERLSMYNITGNSYKEMIKRVTEYGKQHHLL